MEQPDFWDLYEDMLYSRKYEELVKKYWDEGAIPGEMHMNMGEEAIFAGIIPNLIDGDALALDHRGTTPSLLRGVDPVELLLEFMGDKRGICGGNGGHMHIFSEKNRIVSSGIVGASASTAVGFALEMDYNNKDNIAVAFFGEGAMNEGIVLEAMNLASIWDLPVLFVCKDSDLAISTHSDQVTSGKLLDRAASFNIDGIEIDGSDVITTWTTANDAIEFIRNNKRPFFIHAHCEHATGHFLGDPVHRSITRENVGDLVKASVRLHGQNPIKRLFNLKDIMGVIWKSKRQGRGDDPVRSLEKQLRDNPEKKEEREKIVTTKINEIQKRIDEIRGGENV